MANALKVHDLHSEPIDQTALGFAEERARQSGERLTPIRRHIYSCLLQSEHPLGAYDILDMLDGIGSQKPPTVYRSLDWLMKMGLVKKVASVSKYVALNPPKEQSNRRFFAVPNLRANRKF